MLPPPELPIEPWLERLCAATDAELGAWLDAEKEAGVDHCLENRLWRLRQPPDYNAVTVRPNAIERLYHRLKGQPFESYLWEKILHGAGCAIPEHIAHDFLDRTIAVSEVFRCCPTRSVLHRVSATEDTASYWLAIEMYQADDSTPEEFAEFLRRHRHQPILFGWLARLEPRNGPKEQVLTNELAFRDDAAELLHIRLMKHVGIKARRGDLGQQGYEELFRSKDPHVLRTLAHNPSAPVSVLRELAELREVKFARQIRVAARENLGRRGAPYG